MSKEEIIKKALEKMNIISNAKSQTATGKEFDRQTVHEFIKTLMLNAIKDIDKLRQLKNDLYFGKWELPCINIGGKADYTAYCLN